MRSNARPMPLPRSAPVLALLAVLPACALFRSTRNEPLDPSQLARLEPGRTTAREVVELLGAPAQVVQLGTRSAYRYDHSVTKGTALLLVVVNLGNADTREDRSWCFFDERDVLTHFASSLESHRAQYALPWEDVHEDGDREAADADRAGLAGAGAR